MPYGDFKETAKEDGDSVWFFGFKFTKDGFSDLENLVYDFMKSAAESQDNMSSVGQLYIDKNQ